MDRRNFIKGFVGRAMRPGVIEQASINLPWFPEKKINIKFSDKILTLDSTIKIFGVKLT